MRTAVRNVWDFPRPPAVEPCGKTVVVVLNGHTIARSDRALMVLETSHPPTYYIPGDDVDRTCLEAVSHRTYCEWKGQATYYDVRTGGVLRDHAAWCYPNPTAAFAALRDHFCFYPSRMDACFVGDERVQAQSGDFYGGWITSEFEGPFKGGPGTMTW